MGGHKRPPGKYDPLLSSYVYVFYIQNEISIFFFPLVHADKREKDGIYYLLEGFSFIITMHYRSSVRLLVDKGTLTARCMS